MAGSPRGRYSFATVWLPPTTVAGDGHLVSPRPCADTGRMYRGIIGLDRSGKPSRFNAVTRGQAQVGAYSSQQEPNVGIARVPDERVDARASIYKPKKTTYAEIRWVDYPVAGFGAEGPG